MVSVTPLEEANTELTLRLRQQELAAEFAAFGLSTEALQPVLDEACLAASRGLECKLAKVLEYLPDEDCFIMRAGIGWRDGVVGTARLGSDMASPAGYAFQTGQPVLSNHLAEETRFRTPSLLVEHGIHRAFNVLIHTPDWRYGVLEVDSTDRRAFTAPDVAFLSSLAATLAQAIAQQRRIAELRQSRAFMQGVLEASPDCIKIMSAEGRLLFMNGRGLEMHEFGTMEQVAGREFAATWPPNGQAAIRDAVRRAASGETVQMEGLCPTPSGRQRWWDLRFSPYRVADGPPQVISIGRDVSDRHAAQSAMRALNETLERRVEEGTRDVLRSEAQRRAYFDASPEYLALLEVRADGEVIYAEINPAVEAVYGWPRGSVVGRPVQEVLGAEAAAAVVQHSLECARSRTESRFESVRTIGGTERIVSVIVSPVVLPDGDRNLVLFCGRDVSDQRRAENALRQSQKMEAVGQLTGGLAHDFNNLLTGIAGSLELLQTRIAQGRLGELDRFIAAAQGATRRAGALTHRLLAFARRQTLAPKPVDANALVAGMEDMIRRTAGPSVSVQVRPGDALWVVLCDPHQLENALLNLCINARDAMPGGGSLVIATTNLHLSEAEAPARDLPAGAYVALSVTDTGFGMAPEVAARAFDPFFTTKPAGEGTGLGLSMTYGFARQSGGQLHLHSVEGSGTTVTVLLPRHAGEAEAEERPAALSDAPRAERNETVLVVDDEPTVRMLLAEVLEELGYATVEAADGASGLQVLRSDIRIDLLVSDVGLPGGMNGRQMAEAARLVRPGLKVLFITGYAEGGSAGAADNTATMVKPFTMEALASRIKAMIGAAPAS